MADLLNPRVASDISQHLTDIATKVEGLRALKGVSIDLDLPDLDNFNAQLKDEYRNLKSVRKVWGELAADLYLVKRRKLELTREEKSLTKAVKATADQLAKAAKASSKDQAEEARLRAREKEIRDHYDELVEKLKHVNDGLAQMADNQKEVEVITKHAGRGLLDFGQRVLGKAVVAGFQFATLAIRGMESVILKSYDINDRFRASFAGIAAAVGAATPELSQFQQSAKGLYLDKGGLGDIGMSLNEISGEVGTFAATLGIMDQSFVGNTQTLITHGKVLGLDAAAAGEVSRSMLLMGQAAQDVERVFGRVLKQAKVLGVGAAGLAKNLFVAGAGLRALAGPKFQAQMDAAVNKVYALGVSAKSLEGFTEMTDTFDKNAEAMARLNTAFGAHINALQVFAEEDPAKRFGMITEQLEQQGRTVENLGRVEKRFIAQTLGITVDEVNAATRGSKSFDEMTKKMAEAEQATADWQAGLAELRTTLVNWGRQFDRVLLSVMNAVRPLLRTFRLAGPESLGSGIQGITELVERLGDRISGVFNRLAGPEGDKFRKSLERAALALVQMGKSFLEWVEGPGFPKLVKGLETAAGLLAFMVEHSKALIITWAAFKGLSFAAQMVLAFNSISGAIGGVSAAMSLLGVASLAAFWWLIPLVALVGAAAYLLSTSKPPGEAQQAAQRQGTFSADTAAQGALGGANRPALAGNQVGVFSSAAPTTGFASAGTSSAGALASAGASPVRPSASPASGPTAAASPAHPVPPVRPQVSAPVAGMAAGALGGGQALVTTPIVINVGDYELLNTQVRSAGRAIQ